MKMSNYYFSLLFSILFSSKTVKKVTKYTSGVSSVEERFSVINKDKRNLVFNPSVKSGTLDLTFGEFPCTGKEKFVTMVVNL